MAITPLDSTLWGGLFGDAEIAALLDDRAEVASMIRVERALAIAEGMAGVIPMAAAAAIDRELRDITLDPASLAAGTAAAGVPVPALVAALRDRLSPAAAHSLHWGATSQDIVDTAHVLRLQAALDIIGARLTALIDRLATEARALGDVPMAGRTRSQIATPITAGLRVATWASALIALETRLPDVRVRACRVALGGASGTNSVIAPDARAVAEAMADALGLSPAAPWGATRGGLVELGSWLAELSGALGKMAGDLILSGRSEIAEMSAGAGGGSSTMPQKANPVAAEAMVALARYAAGLSGPLHAAMLHHEERDATAWALEWLTLPQLALAAGAGLRHAGDLASSLRVDAERASAVIEATDGALMAEAASFALSRHMPRAEAQALVKRAVAEARQTRSPLAATLARLTDLPVDWAAVFAPEGAVAAARATIDALLGRRGA